MTNPNKTTNSETQETQAPRITAENAKDSVMKDNIFNGLVNKIAKQGADLRETVQVAGIQALIYAMVYDNYDRMSVLAKTLQTNMSERNFAQFRLWIEANSPAAWRKTEDKNFTDGMKFRKSGSKEANPFNLEQAYNVPWYKQEGFTQEEKEAVLATSDTYLQKLENMLKAIDKAIEGKKIEPEEIEAVKVIRSKVSGIVVELKPQAKTPEVALVKASVTPEQVAA